MLIIQLRVNEGMTVGDAEIVLTGISVDGMALKGKVKLGIIAPRHVRVHRTRTIVRKPRRAS